MTAPLVFARILEVSESGSVLGLLSTGTVIGTLVSTRVLKVCSVLGLLNTGNVLTRECVTELSLSVLLLYITSNS